MPTAIYSIYGAYSLLNNLARPRLYQSGSLLTSASDILVMKKDVVLVFI